ncbi:MAG: alpha/beta hydrolase [Bacteroidales bacterium]|nr:alpha/beta hydrolase [Bacteroidales bacterium]
MKNTTFLFFGISLLILVHFNLKATTNSFSVIKDIEWTKVDGITLTMDIYIPQTGKEKYPVIIIYHGGGWLINNKMVMDSMSVYLVEHSEYIVCNVNYRLLGDNNNTTKINQILEDVFGAVIWVKENISKYKGNPDKIAVTGDSAGGQMAAMVILNGKKLISSGFNANPLGFNPSYLPENITAEEYAGKDEIEVQAAILSYPAVDLYSNGFESFESDSNIFWLFAGIKARGIFGDSINAKENPEYYQMVSPIYNIPDVTERMLPPQFCLVGSNDQTTKPEIIKQYVAKCKENGQDIEYWEYEGKPHAFLDSWNNEFLGTNFRRDAPTALDKMIEFLDSVF